MDSLVWSKWSIWRLSNQRHICVQMITVQMNGTGLDKRLNKLPYIVNLEVLKTPFRIWSVSETSWWRLLMQDFFLLSTINIIVNICVLIRPQWSQSVNVLFIIAADWWLTRWTWRMLNPAGGKSQSPRHCHR